MRPKNEMVGKTITIINRSAKMFKRITGVLIKREKGIVIISTPPYGTEHRFGLKEWEIESVNN